MVRYLLVEAGMTAGVGSSIKDYWRRVLVRRRKRILLRNEAQLNFVSLRSHFHCGARRNLSRVFDERQLRAPLTAVAMWREKFYFLA